jgi:hypothetical protein
MVKGSERVIKLRRLKKLKEIMNCLRGEFLRGEFT